MNVDQGVSFISTYKDGTKFYYLYIKDNQEACFGSLDEENWTKESLNPLCVPFDVHQHDWVKIDYYTPDYAFVLHENKTLSKLDISGVDINLLPIPEVTDVEMLSYPIVWRRWSIPS